jgi:hypothetical protein
MHRLGLTIHSSSAVFKHAGYEIATWKFGGGEDFEIRAGCVQVT